MNESDRYQILLKIESLKADYDNLDVDLDDLDDQTADWNRARGWYEAMVWMRDRK